MISYLNLRLLFKNIIHFEAEEGCNDDLAMCLVIYAWLVQQDYFKELTDQDVRKRIYEDQRDQIEQDMSPFGFYC